MNKTLYILIFIYGLFNQLFAQSIIIKSVAHNSKIHLRYVCKSNGIWQDALKYGFYLEKAELSRLDDTLKGKEILYKPIINQRNKPIEKENKIWLDSINNPEYAFIYNTLYGITSNNMMKDSLTANATWGLLMKQADLSINTAKTLGLYHIDSIIDINKIYLYRISIIDHNKKILHQSKLIVNPRIYNQLQLVSINAYTVNANIVSIEFEPEKHLKQYAGFIIERRPEDINQFVSISKTPFIFIKNTNNKNEKNFIVRDTIPDYNKFYYYRIRGISYFDLSCPNGPEMKVKAKEEIMDYPVIDSVKLSNNNTKTKIYYHLPLSIKNSLIKEVICIRSETPSGFATIIYKSGQIDNKKEITDEKPLTTNYYKIQLISHELDTTSSFEHFMMLPDRTPPETPKNLKGEIDTLGKVLITWDANKEKDLLGYRIFRKNSINEESIEITKRIVTVNLFRDSLTLNNLTKDVYYTITAVDKSYNNSGYSNPLKLKKPDIIPPVAGVFKSVYHDKNAIHVKWLNSSSDDVLKIRLYKCNINSNTCTLLREFFAKDSVNSIVDTAVINSNEYTYKLTTIDESGNTSDALSPSIVFETGIRKEISDFTYKIDFEKRKIKLIWSYPENDIFSFIIYRKENNGATYLLKTLKGNINEFVDMNVYPGNEYLYFIKAVFNNGLESKLSKEVKIIF